MQKILCTGAATEYGQAGRVGAIRVVWRARRGGACKGVQGVCKGQGAAHLPVDDAEEVLDATRFQGVSRPPGAGLNMSQPWQAHTTVASSMPIH